ncbi:MAG: DUF3352 domain-containing protein [Cyanobacteria bacterium P01_H01_bin.130]
MSRRVFFSALSIAVGALLSTAIAIAVWIGTHNPLGLLEGVPGKEPAAAQFVPRSAPVMVSLLANPDRLETVRQFLVPPSQRRAAFQEWQRVRDRLLSKTQLDYGQDIRPWLGDEVTFAVTGLDADRDESNGRQPAYLLAASAADGDRAQGFLELFWQKQALAGVNPIFERYKGATITYGEAMDVLPDSLWRSRRRGQVAPRTNLATALVGGKFVLLATDPKVLREAINNVQVPAQNLTSLESYQAAIAAESERPDEDRRLGVVVADFTALAQLSQSPATAAAIGALPASKPFSPFEGAIALVEFDRQGITGNFQLLDRDGGKVPAAAALTEPVTALQYLPRNAAIALGGDNLAALWQGVQEQFQNTLLGDTVIAQVNQLAEQNGVDPETDILPWLTADYALGLVNGDWLVVTSHSSAGEAALARLDQVASDRGWSVGPVMLGDVEAQIWSRLAARGKTLATQVEGVRAQVNGYDILSNSVAALNGAIAAAPAAAPMAEAPAIASDQSFLSRSDVQRNLAQLPQPNDGYAQLDWSAARPILGQVFPIVGLLDGVGQPILDRLDTITVVSYGGEGDRRRITLKAQLHR